MEEGSRVTKPASMWICSLDGGGPMTSTIGAVTNGSWMTFTYVASNPDAQRLIADLLGNFHDVEVDTSTAGDEPIVTVACPNPQRAESLHDVIVTLDWGARPAIAAVNPLSDALTA
jgi:hypothetical protein